MESNKDNTASHLNKVYNIVHSMNQGFLTESKEFFIKKTFELNNYDGSGFVSLEEAHNILKDLGQNIDESEYSGLVRDDNLFYLSYQIAQATNKEGKIDYSGLKQVIVRRIAEFVDQEKSQQELLAVL